jgi:hypothetical protein
MALVLLKEAARFQSFYKHRIPLYKREQFPDGCDVVVQEMLYGVPVQIARDSWGTVVVSNNAALRKQSVYCENLTETRWQRLIRRVRNKPTPRHPLWRVAENSGILNYIRGGWPPVGCELQLFGTMILAPSSNFGYGLTRPTIRINRMILDGKMCPTYAFLPVWAPILYSGRFNPEEVLPLVNGREQLSGKELHPRAGIIIQRLDHQAQNSTFALIPRNMI